MALFGKKKEDKKEETKKPAATKTADVKVEPKKVETKKEETKKPVVKKETKKAAPSKTSHDSAAYKVLLRPVISEKATVGASQGKYVFEVSSKANKVSVKKAVQEIYNVEPIKANMINQIGKFVRRGKQTGRTKNTRKAIITLKKGESIKLYEGI
mgnify:CR=1 FL=1